MRKLSIRDSLKSFFEPHLHPDNGESLKGTKTGNSLCALVSLLFVFIKIIPNP